MQYKQEAILYSTLEAGKILGINPKTLGAWIDRRFIKPLTHERIRNKKMAARFDHINLIEIYLLQILGKYGLDLRFIADSILKNFRTETYVDMEKKCRFSFAGNPDEVDDPVVIDVDPEGEFKIRIYADNKKIVDGVKRKVATMFVNYTAVKQIIDEKIEKFKK